MSHSAEYGLLTIADAAALREHLDALNDAGTDFRAVGMTSSGSPFLIALDGPYAEAEQVIYGSPWDSEVDWNTGRRCQECNAANLHPMASLRFPVVILTRPTPPAKPCRECGPGYRLGDDGCRHTPPAEEAP